MYIVFTPKTKKMKKVLCLLATLCSVSTIAHGFSTLNFGWFDEGDPIRNKFSTVHFTLPDGTVNNFQWSFFWLPTQQIIPKVNITYTSTKSCSKIVRWLYYTNAKWSRLWPLDQQTLNWLKALDSSYNDLTIDWGFYTTCGGSGSTDLYSIYGQISYSDGANDLWNLSAWLMYDPYTNGIDAGATLGLYPSLQYFNNQSPIWYIFDNVGGIGFVGGIFAPPAHVDILDGIKSGGAVNHLFTFWSTQWSLQTTWLAHSWTSSWTILDAWLNTLWNISVLWNILLSRWWLDITSRQSVLGNSSKNSAIIFSDITNTSDILNVLRKNADKLCRGEQKIPDINGAYSHSVDASVLSDYLSYYNGQYSKNPKAICFRNDLESETYESWSFPVIIDLATPYNYDGIDIIVQWRNVVLRGTMPSEDPVTRKKYTLNLFVDNGNVFLQSDTFSGDMSSFTDHIAFDANGNTTGTSALTLYNNSATRTGFNYGVFIRGNIFVNGLIVWADFNAIPNPSIVTNKYYFNGKLASLNTSLAPSGPRRMLLNNIFGNDAPLPSFDSNGVPQPPYSGYQSYANFADVFVRECQINGFATDGVQPCAVRGDNFKYSPFVVMNAAIPTRLFQ
jgi:hypothetical protein